MHIDYSDAHSLFQMVVEPFCNLAQQMATSVATKDAMIAVGIDILLKVLICLYQSLRIFKCVLWMHIIISQTMAKQQSTI